jgi:hypothetical protein
MKLNFWKKNKKVDNLESDSDMRTKDEILAKITELDNKINILTRSQFSFTNIMTIVPSMVIFSIKINTLRWVLKDKNISDELSAKILNEKITAVAPVNNSGTRGR